VKIQKTIKLKKRPKALFLDQFKEPVLFPYQQLTGEATILKQQYFLLPLYFEQTKKRGWFTEFRHLRPDALVLACFGERSIT
jgi:hypothetical protein